jgi:Uma2 family endonuclease
MRLPQSEIRATLAAVDFLLVENLEALLERQFPNCHVIREAGWYFQSAAGRDNVPGPDIMLLSNEDYDRSVADGNWFEGKPLFAIEVISPSERKGMRLRKVGLYLDAGAGAVVEVDLAKRIVLVYWPDADSADVVASGGRIEKPFQADLSEIFARLP